MNVMRSLMFVPGNSIKLMEKAAKSAADVLLLDIEDSVQPKDNKEFARDLIATSIEEGLFGRKLIFPRVNDRESGELLRDLTRLCIPGVHGFVYPKAKNGNDIYFFCKLLETLEYERAVPVGTYKIIPLIETTSAVLHAYEIASASKRVVAIAYGCEDYLADLQGTHGRSNESLFYPRSMIANAARAASVIPVDTVHIDVHNLSDLEENLILARSLGFEGMLVLNPKEIPLVHRYFSPSSDEVEKARRLVDLSKKVHDQGKGVSVEGDVFVGPPLVSKAMKVLERYESIQILDGASE